MPTYDTATLFEKMGRREKFIRRWRYALDHSLIDFGNEPSFMMMSLFDVVERPYLCSRLGRYIVAGGTLEFEMCPKLSA